MIEQKWLDRISSWAIAFGPRILLAIAILIAGIWLIRIFKKWFGSFLGRKKLDTSLKPFLQGILGVTLQVLLVLALLQILGIQMTMFAALLGALGVAAGLALSGTLQNFTSGILILLLKPFKVGDNILAQGQEGTVTSLRLFYTVIRTYDNKTVIAPNSKLSNEVIINLSREGTRRVDIDLKLSYKTPFEQVKAVVDKTVEESDDFFKDPPTRVGIETVEPDGYKVRISIWINAHNFIDTRMAFQEELINQFRTSDIKLTGME
jgi:small conductance mechanosensitive channel